MMITPEQEKELRRAWKERAARREEEEKQRRVQAMEKAKAAARLLKEKYKAERVYLFGSLLWGRHFTERSDIDLLVVGFPRAASYWKMLCDLEEVASPFEVNAVLAEDAFASLKERVFREGKEL